MSIDYPPDLSDRLAAWLALKGRRKRTCLMYKRSAAWMFAYGVSLDKVESFYAYIASFQERGISSSHINNTINCARLLAHYCEEHDLPFDPKYLQLKHVPNRYRTRATLSDDEIEAFLNLEPPMSRTRNEVGWYNGNRELYKMWTVFFSIMAYTGMRPGEVASLKIEDCDFGRGVFVLQEQNVKTAKARYVPIAPNITELVKDRIDKVSGGFLFPSKRSEGHTSSVEWHYQFHRRITRLGIKRPNLVPYSLRHSMITRLLEEDVNIFKVQKLVGHSDIRTTSIYTHLTTKDLIETVKKHPLIRKTTEPSVILQALEDLIAGFGLEKDARFNFNKNRSNDKLIIEVSVK